LNTALRRFLNANSPGSASAFGVKVDNQSTAPYAMSEPNEFFGVLSRMILF